jgi:hypothetical protein
MSLEGDNHELEITTNLNFLVTFGGSLSLAKSNHKLIADLEELV